MTLDLDELTSGWDCPPGEIRARVVVGRDGHELLQLRIDLGVMQMQPQGRPDGQRCHGLASARDFVAHELHVGTRSLSEADWDELEREITQVNYRRMAYATLAEDALHADDPDAARRFLRGALVDVEFCLAELALLARREPLGGEYATLRATLVFDHARLRTQLHIVNERYEDAIEEAERGAAHLARVLAEFGYDEEQQADDPGVSYLRELSRRLRSEYGIGRTLRERLAEAIAHEDFEQAALLRDELEQREPLGPGGEEAPDPSWN